MQVIDLWKEPFDIPVSIGENDIFTVMLNSGEVIDVEVMLGRGKLLFYKEGKNIPNSDIRLYRQETPVRHVKKCKSCGDWR